MLILYFLFSKFILSFLFHFHSFLFSFSHISSFHLLYSSFTLLCTILSFFFHSHSLPSYLFRLSFYLPFSHIFFLIYSLPFSPLHLSHSFSLLFILFLLTLIFFLIFIFFPSSFSASPSFLFPFSFFLPSHPLLIYCI